MKAKLKRKVTYYNGAFAFLKGLKVEVQELRGVPEGTKASKARDGIWVINHPRIPIQNLPVKRKDFKII